VTQISSIIIAILANFPKKLRGAFSFQLFQFIT